VEDAWGIKMQTEATKQAGAVVALTLARAIPIFAAALLGLFIVGGVGFSHIEAVHNAAHDYRHSMSFPCH
jgi:cobalt transporter subunit CbtB